MIDDQDKDKKEGSATSSESSAESETKADLQSRDKRKSRKAPVIDETTNSDNQSDTNINSDTAVTAETPSKTDQKPIDNHTKSDTASQEESETLTSNTATIEAPSDNQAPESQPQDKTPQSNVDKAENSPPSEAKPKAKPSILQNLQKDTKELAQIINSLTDSKSQVHKDIVKKKNRFSIALLQLLQRALIKSSLFRGFFKVIYSISLFFYGIYSKAKSLFSFLIVLGILGGIFYFTYNYFLEAQRRRAQINQNISTNLDKVSKYLAERDDQEKLAPFQRAQVAIILTDLGMLPDVAETAIQKLPQEIALAFNVNCPGLSKWVHQSRIEGHDTMVVIPFEPSFYPFYDPGPETLLTGRPEGENIQKLEAILKRATGIVGVINTSGFRFSTSESDLAPIMRILGSRDLIYLDSHLTGGDVYAKLAAQHRVRTIRIDSYLTDVPNPQKITEILDMTTKIAKRNGFATIMVESAPQYVDYIQAWLNNLKKENIQIVRISNLAVITPNIENLLSKMPSEEEKGKLEAKKGKLSNGAAT